MLTRMLPVVALCVIAACSGGDGSGDDGSDTAPTTRAPEPTDEPASEQNTDGDAEPIDPLRSLGRVDLQPTGNRIIEGPGDLFGPEVIEIELDDEPRWIVPARERDSDAVAWLVADELGATWLVEHDGTVSPLEFTVDPDLGPPLRVFSENMSSPDVRLRDFDDPLPDTRVVGDELGRFTAALTAPTDRYPHDVLGDEIEAGGFGIAGGLDAFSATKINVTIEAPDVIEGVSPMLADVDDDGVVEVIVTVSNQNTGARIAAYEIDGTLVAETDPIGRGNRWRNQLAVAPIGPDGEIELIDVRTPHIGGTLQFFRRDGERFERVASIDGYSTHEIGSRNVDLGIVSDADGDGALDVVLPTQDRRALHAVTRTTDGASVVGELALDAPLTTNISAQRTGDDGVIYAVGTAGGSVLLIG